ncbi:MAG: L-histidine N(alpha)-methyltransferase, partial [Gammaproteobacteria bacterium]|nr:L-histidine N(alpha)-methyltransferase [Gammaproteobacteria bacterium]
MDLPLSSKRFQLQELSTQDSSELIQKDVLEGLFKRPRSLPPKYFYDDEGSKLFDAICKTQDYYPTRTESALLQKHTQEIIEIVKPSTCVELGAGTSTKTEILLSEHSSRSIN